MRRAGACLGLVLGAVACLRAAPEPDGASVSLLQWEFSEDTLWQGWTANEGIRGVSFGASGVTFRTEGTDPQILSPPCMVAPATGYQWLELDIETDAAGTGEFFYTNKTTGRYGGLEPHWRTVIHVPRPGRQVVRVWPFWEGLRKIIRMRVDPPSGNRITLHAVRIAAPEAPRMDAPMWDLRRGPGLWQAMHAAALQSEDEGLAVRAEAPHAIIICPTHPFDAARRSLLRLDATCPGERVIGVYWAAREETGLQGEPIELDAAGVPLDAMVDLRRFETWRGTITHLALGFGGEGRETLLLREAAVLENDPDTPFLRVRDVGFVRGVNRPGRQATVRIVLEHAAGPAFPGGEAVLDTGDGIECVNGGETRKRTARLAVPSLQPGARCTLAQDVIPRAAGRWTCTLRIGEQAFRATLRVEPAHEQAARDPSLYPVPPPRPVPTRYQIGVYYFPGWSPDQMSRWEKQEGFSDRDPVLGWYREGCPEVADWHIKWAVENGISFFVYDWYWRNGKEELGAGLNQGFLQARYRDAMRFAVMWANHAPFSDHTEAQLLEVADYWIERYFRRANYLTVDGVPYVSFFSFGDLLTGLGSTARVRAALDAMRARVRAAGFAGLHVGICGGADRPSLEALAAAGFDSATAYNYLDVGSAAAQAPYRGFVLAHEARWRFIQAARVLPYIPLLTVGWDSRPWHGPRAQRKFGRSTRDFADALARLKANLDASGGRMAILEAWNEWGEGSFIEPNQKYGFEDLEAIRAVFGEPGIVPVNSAPEDVGREGAYDMRAPARR